LLRDDATDLLEMILNIVLVERIAAEVSRRHMVPLASDAFAMIS